MLQIGSTFGAQNASKCALKMEGKQSKTRTNYLPQIRAYAKGATHLERFLPPNVHHSWNPFRRTEIFKAITFLTPPIPLPKMNFK